MKNNFIDFPLFLVPEAVPNYYLGDNGRQVLIVYQVTAPREELEGFLGKILTAVKLDIEKDIALLPITPGTSFSLSRLRKQVPVRTAIVFGMAPSAIGLQCVSRRYTPLRLDGLTCLFADELEVICRERQQGGKRLSAALWQSLQSLFLPKA